MSDPQRPDAAGAGASVPAPAPAPEYGEYASAEQQAAAAGRPWAPPTPSERLAGPDGASARFAASSSARPVDDDAPLGVREDAQDADAAAPVIRSRPWDSWLTMLLLVVQGYNLVTLVPQLADVRVTLTQIFTAWGIDHAFAGAAWSQPAAWVLLVVDAAALGMALWGSLHRLRRGRLTFWVPLVSGLGIGLVSIILLGAMLSSDPASVQLYDLLQQGAMPTGVATTAP